MALAPGKVPGYLEAWQREATPSPDWLRVPSRGTNVEPGPSLDELIAGERALVQASDEVEALAYVVASARDTGVPAGWAYQPADAIGGNGS